MKINSRNTNLNLRHLRALHAIQAEGSFARAADRLGVVPSALPQCQFTNQDGFISLEARSCWSLSCQHLLRANAVRISLGTPWPTFPLGLPGSRFIAFYMPDDLSGDRRGGSSIARSRRARAISVFSSSSGSSATCTSRATRRCERSTTSRRMASGGSVSDPSSESGLMPDGIRHLPEAQRSCPEICPSHPPCPV